MSVQEHPSIEHLSIFELLPQSDTNIQLYKNGRSVKKVTLCWGHPQLIIFQCVSTIVELSDMAFGYPAKNLQKAEQVYSWRRIGFQLSLSMLNLSQKIGRGFSQYLNLLWFSLTTSGHTGLLNSFKITKVLKQWIYPFPGWRTIALGL